MQFKKTLCALTAAAAIGFAGLPAFSYSTKPDAESTSLTFYDIDRDGLEDMILSNNSTVAYFKGVGNSSFQFKQKIYTPKNKEKLRVAIIATRGELELVILSGSKIRNYRLNKGRFEEYKLIPRVEDEPEDKPDKKPTFLKDSV